MKKTKLEDLWTSITISSNEVLAASVFVYTVTCLD